MKLELNMRELHKRRLLAGLTQEMLATRAGITTQYLRKLDRYEKTNPSPPVVKALAEAVGCRIEDIAEVVGDGTGEDNSSTSNTEPEQRATG